MSLSSKSGQPPVLEPQTTEINQLRMGLDNFRRACAERPDKVVDAFVAMCDDYEDTLLRLSMVPLSTEPGVIMASQMQGRAQALQAVLNELFDQVTSNDDPDTQGQDQEKDL